MGRSTGEESVGRRRRTDFFFLKAKRRAYIDVVHPSMAEHAMCLSSRCSHGGGAHDGRRRRLK